MAAVKVKAPTVSARELSAMVDKAVTIAAKRLDLQPEPENIIIRWDLVGRILRDASLAQKFSEDVAGQLKKAGVAVEPATLIIKKQIIAGFIERARLTAPLRFM